MTNGNFHSGIPGDHPLDSELERSFGFGIVGRGPTKPNHSYNAISALATLDLDESYRETLESISRAWGETEYIGTFLDPGILNLVKTPEDLAKVSEIMLSYFRQIHARRDGSYQFAEAIMGAVTKGEITSIGMFEHVCRNVFEQNEDYREAVLIVDAEDSPSRGGEQYEGYVEQLIDKEILKALKSTAELLAYFKQLIVETYEDETLVEDRVLLHKETQKEAGVGAQEDRLQQDELKVLLRIRRAIIRAVTKLSNPFYPYNRKKAWPPLRELVIAMGDGDLAYTTHNPSSTTNLTPKILGVSDYGSFIEDLRFSPELQRELAVADDYKSIPLDLANNKHITPEAQVAMLDHQNPNVGYFVRNNLNANSIEMMRAVMEEEGEGADLHRMHLAFTDRDFPVEILELIQQDPKLELIHRAKTDSLAEIEMIKQATSPMPEKGSIGAIWLNYIATRSKLHTEEAVRILSELNPTLLAGNRHLEKHQLLAQELGLGM